MKKAFPEVRATTVCCAHEDTVLYPLAKVHMEVKGKPIEVEAAMSYCLPVGVLLVGYRRVPTAQAINPTELWIGRTRKSHGNNDKSNSMETEG